MLNKVKSKVLKQLELQTRASKVVRFGTGAGLAKFLGPLGLGAEAVFEVGMAVPGYARGESGKRLLGDGILGLIPILRSRFCSTRSECLLLSKLLMKN